MNWSFAASLRWMRPSAERTTAGFLTAFDDVECVAVDVFVDALGCVLSVVLANVVVSDFGCDVVVCSVFVDAPEWDGLLPEDEAVALVDVVVPDFGCDVVECSVFVPACDDLVPEDEADECELDFLLDFDLPFWLSAAAGGTNSPITASDASRRRVSARIKSSFGE